MQHFGPKVKLARLARKLTLKELSALSGVSPTMLSEIERNKKTPTIDIACNIADALDVSILDLLSTKERKRVHVIRATERSLIPEFNPKIKRYLLSPSAPSSYLDFIYGVIPPGESTGPNQAHLQGVKEYLIVTRGMLQLRADKEYFLLNTGDSMYFEADVEHEIKNIGTEECHFYFISDTRDARTCPGHCNQFKR